MLENVSMLGIADEANVTLDIVDKFALDDFNLFNEPNTLPCD